MAANDSAPIRRNEHGHGAGQSWRLPSLNALRSFEVAARLSSMTLAANELRVTQGAVSRQVANLEAELGVRLFSRSGRQLALTREGAEYFSIVSSIFAQLHAQHARYMCKLQRRSLRIRLPPTFAIRWFMSRLHRLHALDPSLEVQITTSHKPANFAEGDVDLAIWSTPDPVGDFRKIRLFGERLIPVCSPRLLERRGPLRHPSELRNHVLLYSLQRPEDWTIWLSAVGLADLQGDEVMRFESSNLAYQAALEGIGVGLAQLRLVQDDLDAGRLVAPFPMPIRSPRVYYLIVPLAESRQPKTLMFRRWLHAEIVRENAAAAQREWQLLAAQAGLAKVERRTGAVSPMNGW